MSELFFDARIHYDQLKRDTEQINAQISAWAKHTENKASEVDSVFRRLGGVMAGYFSLQFAGNFAREIATVRGEFQQLEVAFETMLGNKAKADELMAQVVDFAATTPFELRDVASGAKSLLAFGVAGDEILPTLKSLGDVSAGLSVPIERLILNFGQVRTQANMTGRELRDFQIAGVPIISELAKNLNKSEKEIQEMVSAGVIGFNEVNEAFRTMSSEGGKFANLMDKQSKTVTGMISNLKDSWNQMLNSIGQSNEGVITGVLNISKGLIENYEAIITTLKLLVAAYGTYKAAVIFTSVAQKVATISGVYDIATKKLQIGATIKATAAQSAFNTVLLANPYALAIAGIVTLVGALGMLNKKWAESIDGKRKYDEFMANNADIYDENIKSAEALIKTVNNHRKSENDRMAALKELQNQYPAIFGNMDLYNEKLQDTVNILKKVKDEESDLSEQRIREEIALIKSQEEKLKKSIQGQQTGTGAMTQYGIGGMSVYGTTQQLKYNELVEKRILLEDDLKKKVAERQQQEADQKEATRPIETRIAEIKTLIADSEAALARMRKKGSQASIDDIKAQEDKVKEFKNTLTALTGITKKEYDKQVVAENEKAKAIEELKARELELTNQTEAAKIAAMKEGADKQRAQAELDYQLRLQQINRQKAEMVKAYNASLGYDPGDKGYTDTIPAGYQSELNKQAISAKQERDNKILQIEKETAEKEKAMRKEVADLLISEFAREVAAVKEKYAKQLDLAAAAGNYILHKQLTEQQEKEITDITVRNNLERLNFEEEIETRRAGLKKKEFESDIKIEIEKAKIAKEYAQKKIAELKKVNTKSAKQDIELLKIQIDEIDKYITEASKKRITDLIDSIITGIGNVISALDNAGRLSDDMAESLSKASNVGEGIMQLVKGNYVGGAAQILATIISDFAKTAKEPFEKWFVNFRDEIDKAVKSIELAKSALGGVIPTQAIDVLSKKLYDLAITTKDLNEKTKIDNYYQGGTWFDQLNWFLSQLSGNNILESIKKIREEIPLLTEKLLTGNLSDSQKKAIEETLSVYESLVNSLNNTIADITGTSVDDLSKSLIEAFIEGENSAVKWGDTVEDVIKNIVIKQLSLQAIQKPIEEALIKFTVNAKDGVDKFELDQFDADMRAIYAATKPAFEAAMSTLKAMGIDIVEKSKPDGLSGAIKGISEETATLIAGQFFAMRELNQKSFMTAQEQLSGINNSVAILGRIEQNTRHNARLNEIADGVSETNKILKEKL